MSEFKEFLNKSRIIAEDESHRLKIQKAISTYESKVEEQVSRQFKNWQEARETAALIKDYVM